MKKQTEDTEMGFVKYLVDVRGYPFLALYEARRSVVKSLYDKLRDEYERYCREHGYANTESY